MVTAKKTGASKPSGGKSATKKSAASKVGTKKPAAGKPATKKSAASKVGAKKPSTGKTARKKSVARKVAAKQSGTKKTLLGKAFSVGKSGQAPRLGVMPWPPKEQTDGQVLEKKPTSKKDS